MPNTGDDSRLRSSALRDQYRLSLTVRAIRALVTWTGAGEPQRLARSSIGVSMRLDVPDLEYTKRIEGQEGLGIVTLLPCFLARGPLEAPS